MSGISLPTAVSSLRLVNHYLLFGADRVVLADAPYHWNPGCRNPSMYAAHDHSLAPLIKSGHVIRIDELRCVKLHNAPAPWDYAKKSLTRAESSKSTHWTHDQFGAMWKALDARLSRMLKRSDIVRDGDLLIFVDEDERLFVTTDHARTPHAQLDPLPAYDLQDVRRHMVAHRICVLYVNWRIFGSSGHRCPPPHDLAASFTRRIRTEAETTHAERLRAVREVERDKMQAPYWLPKMTNAPGKTYLNLYGVGPKSCLLKHSCNERCADLAFSLCGDPLTASRTPGCRAVVTDVLAGSHAAPTNATIAAPFQVRVHHYAFLSHAQWAEKQTVWQRTHGRLYGNKPPPMRYDEVEDTAMAREIARRIHRAPNALARPCLQQLFFGTGTWSLGPGPGPLRRSI